MSAAETFVQFIKVKAKYNDYLSSYCFGTKMFEANSNEIHMNLSMSTFPANQKRDFNVNDVSTNC